LNDRFGIPSAHHGYEYKVKLGTKNYLTLVGFQAHSDLQFVISKKIKNKYKLLSIKYQSKKSRMLIIVFFFFTSVFLFSCA